MTTSKKIITRFAPSPTGFLHIGHLASIIFSKNFALKNNGEMILRIEDIDFTRCKSEFIKNIVDDLNWFNISYRRTTDQSKRLDTYNEALNLLKDKGLAYQCWLTRSEANDILSAPHNNIKSITDTDLLISDTEINIRKKSGFMPAWRIRLEKAIKLIKKSKENLSWFDLIQGEVELNLEKYGDFVIARKDISTSYHLSVTLDDDADCITHIIRGNELFEFTHIHRLLQIIFNLKPTKWLHHPLIKNLNGKKISKRNSEFSLLSLRKKGLTSKEIISFTEDAMSKNGFQKVF